MRIFLATVLVMFTFNTALCQTNSETSHVSETTLSKSETKKLLWNYSLRLFSSYELNEPMWPLLILIKERPVKELETLYKERDKTLLNLSGRYFGVLCRYVAPKHFCDLFINELSNSDPKIRRFACYVLGEIGEAKAIPSLKKLLNDDAKVPGYWDGRVSLAAAYALSIMGNADGLPVYFDCVQRDWYHCKGAALSQFRRFSNKDCGDSLEAWREHFKTNPPQLQDNRYYLREMAGEGSEIPDNLLLLKKNLILNTKIILNNK